jgi:hypothetical protein
VVARDESQSLIEKETIFRKRINTGIMICIRRIKMESILLLKQEGRQGFQRKEKR